MAALGLLVLCTGCIHDESSEKPTVRQAANCDLPPAKRGAGVTVVYLVRTDLQGRGPADERNFVPVARRRSDADAATPLHAALDALLEGTTANERRAGCVSTFDDDEHLLRRVELVEGTAVVDFRRRAFLDELAIVSASHAGAVFSRQIALTLFQFPQVRSLRFELDGDCRAFGEFAQAGVCVVVRRPR